MGLQAPLENHSTSLLTTPRDRKKMTNNNPVSVNTDVNFGLMVQELSTVSHFDFTGLIYSSAQINVVRGSQVA